ncbi:NUDIX hydrolase [Nonomuraea sp. NPDC004702]
MPTPGSPLTAALAAHTLRVAAVIVGDEEHEGVLLLRREVQARYAPGHWGSPTGKAARGEAIAQTTSANSNRKPGWSSILPPSAWPV